MVSKLHNRTQLLVIAGVVLLVVTLFIWSQLRYKNGYTVTRQNGITWQSSSSGIVVALFKGELGSMVNLENPPALEEVRKDQGDAVAINGTFFTGSYDRAMPAGFFQTDNLVMREKTTDQQLTRVVIYDRDKNTLGFIKAEEFNASSLSSLRGFAFQTGPQLLVNNELQQEEISSSVNGLGRYQRTLLGVTDQGEYFFVITTKPVTLLELGGVLRSMPIFKDRIISVVNLDGGPSVAMTSAAGSHFEYNSRMQLPLVLGAKVP